MNEPTLTKARVLVAYSASDGYRSEVTYASHARHFKPPHDPREALLEAVAELARLAELFGFGSQALVAAGEAVAHVQAWRDEQRDA